MRSLSTPGNVQLTMRAGLTDVIPHPVTKYVYGQFTLLLTASFLLAVPALAQNQDAELIANQLNRIQRDLQVLSRQVFKGDPGRTPSATSSSISSPSSSNAYIIRVEDRLTQLEGETRQNTGNVENISHTLNQISARLDSLANDIGFRLTSIEQRLNILTRNPQTSRRPTSPLVAGQTPPPTSPQLRAAPRLQGVQQVGPTTGGSTLGGRQGMLGTITQQELTAVRQQNGDTAPQPVGQSLPSNSAGTAVQQQAAVPKKILPPGTPKEQYKFAFSLVRRAEFGQATEALEEFIKTHPSDPLTSNARYWLGRTHYVRKDYRRAAEVFLTAYQSQPNGKKAADNLLRLGMSLAGMSKKKEACATFNKLKQDFPDSSVTVKKQLVQQSKKIGCG